MINIQPYIDKLELLKDWINLKIEWWEMDKYDDAAWKIFQKTGMMVWSSRYTENFYIPTFDEYCKLRTKSK